MMLSFTATGKERLQEAALTMQIPSLIILRYISSELMTSHLIHIHNISQYIYCISGFLRELYFAKSAKIAICGF